MHAAAVRYELKINNSRTLKDKRRVLKPLLDSLHRNFNVSAAEVDFHDLTQRATIGVAMVSSSAFQISKTSRKIEQFIMTFPEIEVIASETSFLEEM